MAKHITVRAAQPDTKNQEIEPVYLTITGCFPFSLNDEEIALIREGFREDAERLFIALRSLPGGTFNRLLILMLQKSASSLIVPLNFHDEEKPDTVGELAQACQRLREIIRNEFSHDGQSWDSIKRYQADVDQALVAIRKARGEGKGGA